VERVHKALLERARRARHNNRRCPGRAAVSAAAWTSAGSDLSRHAVTAGGQSDGQEGTESSRKGTAAAAANPAPSDQHGVPFGAPFFCFPVEPLPSSVRAWLLLAPPMDAKFWKEKLKEAERELDAAARLADLNAADKKLMKGKVELKRLEQHAPTRQGSGVATSAASS
jgi:hypothetical protein